MSRKRFAAAIDVNAAATAGALALPPTVTEVASASAPGVPLVDADAFVSGERVRQVPLASITRDPRAQPRTQLDPATVDSYRDAMRPDPDAPPSWGSFPPVVVFEDGATLTLGDGFHRVAAAEAAGLATVRAEVRPGGLREAILHSVGANARHGLPRTNADKRRAVLTLLQDPEWSLRSDRWIAEQAAVHHATVGRLRGEVRPLAQSASQPSPAPPTPAPVVRTGRDGRSIRTGRINQGRPAAATSRAPVDLPLPRALVRALTEAGWQVRLVATPLARGGATEAQRAEATEVVRGWAREALGSGVRALVGPGEE